jgi:hypothetical protein
MEAISSPRTIRVLYWNAEQYTSKYWNAESTSAATMTPPSPAASCRALFARPGETTVSAPWETVRACLHPSQAVVGYAAVKRKYDKDYSTAASAQRKMDGSVLPVVLGPQGVPYLVDAHHTVSALEAGHYPQVSVKLQILCDWSDDTPAAFEKRMKKENFMIGEGIPAHMADLRDDPWRSLAALVRKVNNDQLCPRDNRKCLRGYLRACQPDGSLTPFFEFRWAHFLRDAYQTGCEDPRKSYWDEPSDCVRFARTYEKLRAQSKDMPIPQYKTKAWREAAALLVPLCRGAKAQTYTLPSALGPPMGDEPLPGVVAGRNTPIATPDPSCAAPKCPPVWSSSSSYLARFWKRRDNSCGGGG